MLQRRPSIRCTFKVQPLGRVRIPTTWCFEPEIERVWARWAVCQLTVGPYELHSQLTAVSANDCQGSSRRQGSLRTAQSSSRTKRKTPTLNALGCAKTEQLHRARFLCQAYPHDSHRSTLSTLSLSRLWKTILPLPPSNAEPRCTVPASSAQSLAPSCKSISDLFTPIQSTPHHTISHTFTTATLFDSNL